MLIGVCVYGFGVSAAALVVKTARHENFDEHLSADLVVKTAGENSLGTLL